MTVHKGSCFFNIPRNVYPPIALPTGIFVPVMMKVMTVDDETGLPEDLTMLPPGRYTEMVGNEKYFVTYVPAEVIQS